MSYSGGLGPFSIGTALKGGKIGENIEVGNREDKWWRHKNKIYKIIGEVGISGKNKMKNVCKTFVFHFSWVLQPSQKKLKTMLMQFFFSGGGGGSKQGAFWETCRLAHKSSFWARSASVSAKRGRATTPDQKTKRTTLRKSRRRASGKLFFFVLFFIF